MSDDTKNESSDSFRVAFFPCFDKSHVDGFFSTASSLNEAHAILNAIADYTLFLHEQKLMDDYSNFGGVDRLVDGEWEEVNEHE